MVAMALRDSIATMASPIFAPSVPVQCPYVCPATTQGRWISLTRSIKQFLRHLVTVVLLPKLGLMIKL
jgi:hypothetical protein